MKRIHRGSRRERFRKEGMTLIDIAVSVAILAIGLLALGGVMVSGSHAREYASARRQVMTRLESLSEDVKGTAPDAIESQYGNKTYSLGANPILGLTSAPSPIQVAVDSTNPLLLTVTLTATYAIRGNAESLSLMTQVYNP